MVGWMDDEALHRTLTTGRATYWSRSRQEYWRKGDTSGHVQLVRVGRAGLRRRRAAAEVDQVGPACHTGDRTCFDAGALEVVDPAVQQPGDRGRPVTAPGPRATA